MCGKIITQWAHRVVRQPVSSHKAVVTKNWIGVRYFLVNTFFFLISRKRFCSFEEEMFFLRDLQLLCVLELSGFISCPWKLAPAAFVSGWKGFVKKMFSVIAIDLSFPIAVPSVCGYWKTINGLFLLHLVPEWHFILNGVVMLLVIIWCVLMQHVMCVRVCSLVTCGAGFKG